MLHTFEIALDWKLVNERSAIDRFGGGWSRYSQAGKTKV